MCGDLRSHEASWLWKQVMQDRAFWGGIENAKSHVTSGADLPMPSMSGFDCMVAFHLVFCRSYPENL